MGSGLASKVDLPTRPFTNKEIFAIFHTIFEAKKPGTDLG